MWFENHSKTCVTPMSKIQATEVFKKYFQPWIDQKILDRKGYFYNEKYNANGVSTPIMITTLYEPFLIVFINNVFTEIFGWTLAEARKRSPKMLQGKHTNHNATKFKKRCCENGGDNECDFPVIVQTINHHKSGRPLFMDIIIDVLWDHTLNGKYEGFVTYFHIIDLNPFEVDKIILLAKYILEENPGYNKYNESKLVQL